MTDVAKKPVEVPDLGVMINVPADWDQPAIDRRINEFKQWYATRPQGDVPQPTPDEFTYRTRGAQDDPWYTQAGRNVLGFLRGTGQSVATVGDIVSNVPEAVRNDLRYFSDTGTTPQATRPSTPYEDYSAPVSKAYNEAVPAMPKGYETSETLGEITGPALVEALVSGKPRGIPYRIGRDVGLGIGGGEVGGEIASRVGGEQYRDLGRLLGGATTAVGVPRLVRGTTSHLLSEPGGGTQRNLETIDRTNERLRAAGLPEIPPSVGLIGNKAASTLEDVTGRTVIGAVPGGAARARTQQMTGLEAAVEDALQKARGGRATGPITQETIGREVGAAIDTTRGKVSNEVRRIQNELENAVGSESPVGLQSTMDALDEVINNPKQYGAQQIRQAQELKAAINANRVPTPRHPIPPYTGPRPTIRPKQVTPGTAGYGAVKDTRSNLGAQLESGTNLHQGLKKQTYGGMTQDMREAAAMQGVDPEHFNAAQAETSRLLNQIDPTEGGLPETAGRTEGQIYSKTVGAKGTSHLDPLFEHTPDEALKLLVDDLEMKLRRGSAGGPVDPKNFDPKALQAWRTLDPVRKRRITGGRPEIEQQLNDAADIAIMEEVRGGRRTRPGTTGSTLGASANYSVPMILGALKAPLLTTGSILGPVGIGKMFTSPGFARMVADPSLSVGQMLARAVGGGTAGANFRDTPEDRANKARQDQLNQYMKDQLGLGGQ